MTIRDVVNWLLDQSAWWLVLYVLVRGLAAYAEASER